MKAVDCEWRRAMVTYITAAAAVVVLINLPAARVPHVPRVGHGRTVGDTEMT